MIIQGDCLEVMKTFPDNYFSAVVTDPPYGLHFMGKDWDKFKKTNFDEKPDKHFIESRGMVRDIRCANSAAGEYDPKRDDEFQAFIQKVALEALRITKPGGHCLMFGAPRRFHRQICALEDAGWEIRDNLCWLFGSGFPKSHNHFGLEGYGTALKPAYEPIIMAMKPLDGTFKQNAEKWGQAGINIDGCRIGSATEVHSSKPNHERNGFIKGFCLGTETKSVDKGRWPANVIFDEEAAEMLDEQSGKRKSPKGSTFRAYGAYKTVGGEKNYRPCHDNGLKRESVNGFGDYGGASRFFYCAKTSSRERNEGLEGLPDTMMDVDREGRNQAGFNSEDRPPMLPRKNSHPTVKPLALMRYLITLVSPPTNALILDPFAGSGSTILAAKQLGINAIGIEKQEEYAEIARARLKATSEKIQNSVQMDLFKSD